jgi:hypothetical protein
LAAEACSSQKVVSDMFDVPAEVEKKSGGAGVNSRRNFLSRIVPGLPITISMGMISPSTDTSTLLECASAAITFAVDAQQRGVDQAIGHLGCFLEFNI